MRFWKMASGCAFMIVIAGCDMGPKSGYGFTLPDGDGNAGQEAFVRFQCGDCHAIAGREDLREKVDPIMTVNLGGKTTRIETYGQLVTSVINPSHKISQKFTGELVEIDGVSRMRNYNEVMTVSELIDIVTFLQAQYELEPYTPTTYQGFLIPMD